MSCLHAALESRLLRKSNKQKHKIYECTKDTDIEVGKLRDDILPLFVVADSDLINDKGLHLDKGGFRVAT